MLLLCQELDYTHWHKNVLHMLDVNVAYNKYFCCFELKIDKYCP